ncbi:thiamine phosphate synthase [Echinicola rosea]|uniref:Thiamine phosphate synthase n=1 Tax=Echinicola rosea TaxID=1807691 RepID=A0ABQ1V7C9_9BACT|nr:thiamine phosphate synthase [Echinicola rosea]GGF39314.1 thiamine phosphate synthase [Echinicola rosea]
MKLIAISSPEKEKEEIKTMVQLLDHGLYRLHIRKPGWSEGQMEDLLARIPAGYYPKISLHEHHSLADRYALGGIHFKGDYPVLQREGMTSKSFHRLEALEDMANRTLSYAFISPVFDSISKPGYHQGFPPHKLRAWTTAHKHNLPFQLFALGGVTPGRLPFLHAAGFDGAAIIGGIWSGKNTAERLKRFLNYKNNP